MRLHLTLAQKGFILIGVPLVFQVIFITALNHALNQTEAELAAANRAKELNYHFNRLTQLSLNATAVAFLYGPGQRSFAAYRKLRAQTEKEFFQLRRLGGSDPDTLASIDRLEQGIDRVFLYLDESRRLKEFGQVKQAFRYLSNLKLLAAYMNEQIDSAMNRYRQIEASTPEIQQRQRAVLKLICSIALVLNMALALFLAVIFNRSTASRHAVVMDNARRFAGGKPLKEPLSGADEIAQLDSVFHEMVTTVKEAEKQRAAFMNMIAHDIRAPLTSIHITAGLLGKSADELCLQEDTRQNIVRIERDAERLIALVSDFLDLDRMDAGAFKLVPAVYPVAYVLENALQAVRGLALDRGGAHCNAGYR